MQDGETTMTSTSSGGGSNKVPLIAGFVLLLVAIAAGWFVLKSGGVGSPIKKVASLDSDAIYQLEDFTKAREHLDKKNAEFTKKLEEFAATQSRNEEGARKVREKASEFEMELQQERNKTLQPLQTRAEAAIAIVARNKNYKVVLDKRIVVYGVEDITEEVKSQFTSKTELKLPAEDDTKDSPIAYFDQDVVRNLKAFQEVDLKLAALKNELGEEFRKKAQGRTQQEVENLQKELMMRMEARQESEVAPLVQAVNQSVSEAAEANNVSLVLDKVHVMYGGRNLTNEVVDTFLKKTGTKGTPAGNTKAPSSP